MTKLPAMMLYPGDYYRQTAGVSHLGQYLYLRLKLIAHDSDRYGYISSNGSPIQPEIVARKCDLDVALYDTLLTELFTHAIPERTPEGLIFFPDMVEADKKRKAAVRYGRKGGNPKLLHDLQEGTLNPPDNIALNIEDENELPPILKTPKFRAAWLLWREHRRQKGTKITDMARKLQFRKLTEMGPDHAVEAIFQSIANDWTGIFPPKVNGTSGNGESPESYARRVAAKGAK